MFGKDKVLESEVVEPKLSKYFVLYDTKAKMYVKPLVHENKATALRWFGDMMNNKENVVAHPGDYEMYYVGLFDHRSGRFVPADHIELLGTGNDVREEEVVVPLKTEEKSDGEGN